MNLTSNQQYFIGLMSGTSTDGVDGALILFEQELTPRIISFESIAMPAELRETFLQLNHAGDNEIEKSYLAANHLADLYAQCCLQLLHSADLKANQITAIGAHGQTVRHRPDLGFTVQLNAPARLAELTGIDVIADFRSRDIAAGGQGAPFAPLLHQALFADPQKTRVVLNLGGIANITLLRPNAPLLGFDTGPANALMDGWISHHQGLSFDKDGAWGASGKVIPSLLNRLLDEPYFQQAAPKSTGRDLFNMSWLKKHLQAEQLSHLLSSQTQSTGKPTNGKGVSTSDVMATLRALTSRSVAQSIQRYSSHVDEVIVCGGGSKNKALMAELTQLMQCDVKPIEAYGLDSQAVEALAFAWLAKACVERKPLGFPSVTGSSHPSIAGAIYPSK
ncbi:anhydro-N-acetylmuramic acid kinase [Pelistega europaea]|uniref:Anhydro-N-acetylmuramic acid kinase n=1 Tax=Pelistega europaea TaxID=106147 RepID=A0A7Y4LB41_9BURK|nr:anhydro-N-acetylmuramic acid kinase [Pelistega europaea]NOL49281.1 anhydro-N-acetylmuramic acid kinase [Pelistega europaea]